jgi:hypothetical protein
MTDVKNRHHDLLVIFLVVLVRFLVPLPSAAAAESSCGANNHKWDGTKVLSPNPSSHPYVDGADAFIRVRTAALCTSQNNSFAYAYDMISVPGAGKLAQVGWTNSAVLCCLRFQWEWFVNANTQYHAYWGSPSLGSLYSFTVELQADGKLHMLQNQSVPPCNVNNECPVTSWSLHNVGTGSNAQFFGEVNYPGSDMPGSSSSRAEFSTIKELWNGSWSSNPWDGLTSGCTYYRNNVLTRNSSFEIWTNPINPPRSC